MTFSGSRLRQIGWLMALAICFALFVALTFRVNSVKSEVRLAERQIVQLKRENLLLETEFQTRANQQQLADWNAIEFGYKAPRADQYLEGERQLASLGLPRQIGAPSPIRVARADAAMPDAAAAAMVSPVSGRKLSADYDSDSHGERHREGSSASRDFASAFGDTAPIVARVAEVVE